MFTLFKQFIYLYLRLHIHNVQRAYLGILSLILGRDWCKSRVKTGRTVIFPGESGEILPQKDKPPFYMFVTQILLHYM